MYKVPSTLQENGETHFSTVKHFLLITQNIKCVFKLSLMNKMYYALLIAFQSVVLTTYLQFFLAFHIDNFK